MEAVRRAAQSGILPEVPQKALRLAMLNLAGCDGIRDLGLAIEIAGVLRGSKRLKQKVRGSYFRALSADETDRMLYAMTDGIC